MDLQGRLPELGLWLRASAGPTDDQRLQIAESSTFDWGTAMDSGGSPLLLEHKHVAFRYVCYSYLQATVVIFLTMSSKSEQGGFCAHKFFPGKSQ